jgi:hypothetical protein
MFLRAKPVVAWLLAGSPKPDRSKVMTQTKSDTLVLQVGGWAWGANSPCKKTFVEKTSGTPRMDSINITAAGDKRVEEKS